MGLFRRWLSRSRFGWFGALVVRSIWADPGRSLARIPVCGFSIAWNSVGPGSEMNTAEHRRKSWPAAQEAKRMTLMENEVALIVQMRKKEPHVLVYRGGNRRVP